MKIPISARFDKDVVDEIDQYAEKVKLDRTKMMSYLFEAGLNQIALTGELKVTGNTKLVFDEIIEGLNVKK